MQDDQGRHNRLALYYSGAIAALAFLVIAAAPAEAAAKKNTPPSSAAAETPEVPGDDIFGFTSATDLGNLGDIGFAEEITGITGKRDGSYNALFSKSELGYTISESWWIGGSAFASRHRIHNVTDMTDVSGTEFFGLSFEIKHRLIKRSAGNPFAVTLALEPVWTRIDGATGLRSEAYSAEFKILTDAVIVPDKVFWAANLVYVPQRAQDVNDRSIWLKTSFSSISTALTFQLSPTLFVGAEARHLASYGKGTLDDRLGYAIYVGPTLLWKISEKVAFNATWQPQVSGRSIDNPDLRYDLDNFERAQFRAKFSVALN